MAELGQRRESVTAAWLRTSCGSAAWVQIPLPALYIDLLTNY